MGFDFFIGINNELFIINLATVTGRWNLIFYLELTIFASLLKNKK